MRPEDMMIAMRNALKPGQSFRFHCDQCGDCCRHRKDIILTPFDLNRIARHFGTTPKAIVDRYCIVYIGDSSRFPVVLLKPEGKDEACPCSLNICQMRDIQNGIVWCRRKGGEVAEVNVASFVFPHVQRYLILRGRCAPDAPLFISQKGNRMTRNALWKSFASKQRELGLNTGIHRFRHTFLSDVDHHSNGSAALARDLGGHSSVAITNNYLHTTPEERRTAVNNMSYACMLAE